METIVSWGVDLNCKEDILILAAATRRDAGRYENIMEVGTSSDPMAFGHGMHRFDREKSGKWHHETYRWYGHEGEHGEVTYAGFKTHIEIPGGYDLVVMTSIGRHAKVFTVSDGETTWWLDPVEGWKKED